MLMGILFAELSQNGALQKVNLGALVKQQKLRVCCLIGSVLA
jgi:hypothetical protein